MHIFSACTLYVYMHEYYYHTLNRKFQRRGKKRTMKLDFESIEISPSTSSLYEQQKSKYKIDDLKLMLHKLFALFQHIFAGKKVFIIIFDIAKSKSAKWTNPSFTCQHQTANEKSFNIFSLPLFFSATIAHRIRSFTLI